MLQGNGLLLKGCLVSCKRARLPAEPPSMGNPLQPPSRKSYPPLATAADL
jgi:hypothetical protein